MRIFFSTAQGELSDPFDRAQIHFLPCPDASPPNHSAPNYQGKVIDCIWSMGFLFLINLLHKKIPSSSFEYVLNSKVIWFKIMGAMVDNVCDFVWFFFLFFFLILQPSSFPHLSISVIKAGRKYGTDCKASLSNCCWTDWWRVLWFFTSLVF